MLYCPFPGHCKGSHYYPVCLKPLGDDNTDNDYDDLHLAIYAFATFSDYKNQLNHLTECCNQTDYKVRWLRTGIIKPRIFLGLQEKHTLNILQCFRYDIMHLILPNLLDLLISLWRGTIAGDKEDYLLWDWAVLKGDVWIQHGQDVASMKPYSSFDCPPCNPAKKINSGYKAWEFLMYIYALGSGLFYNILLKKYWKNLCLLVSSIRILHQFSISTEHLQKAHHSLLTFVLDFEVLYYQQRAN